MGELEQERRLKRFGARRLATTYGLPVFPIKPNAKTPAIEGWQEAATRDPKQIDAWWDENPDYNIGVSTQGLVVVDIDVKKDGLTQWQPLADMQEMLGELPKTLEVKTWSGGRHIYFRAPEGVSLRNSVSQIAEGVDIRADGGYVVGPGSVIDGKRYDIIDDGADPEGRKNVACSPAWLVEQAGRRKERSENAGVAVVEESQAAIDRAWEWVREHAPEARQGEGGDATTIGVALKLFDFVTQLDTARPMFDWWNQHKAFPAWEAGALEDKLLGGMKYRQNARGVASPDYMPLTPELQPLAEPVVESVETPKKGLLPVLTFKEACDSALAVGPEPLIDGIYAQRGLSVVYGASGGGKTFVVMDGDYHLAAGMPWFGREVKQGAVLWVAAERAEEARHRFLGMAKKYGRDDVPFFIVPKTVNLFDPKADLRPLIDTALDIEARHGVKVEKVTCDTLARVMVGGDENSTKDMGILVANMATLIEAVRAHVSLVHHTSIGEERMRGAYALKGAIDSQIEIRKNRSIYIEKASCWKDHYVLGKFDLEVKELGLHPRSGKMVTTCVVNEAVASVKDLESPDLLRDAIVALLKKEGRPPDDMVGKSFITMAARTANLCGLLAEPRVSEKAYQDRVDRLLADSVSLASIKWLKRGQYQCL